MGLLRTFWWLDASISAGSIPGTGLLGLTLCVCFSLICIANQFSRVVLPIYFPISSSEFPFPHPYQISVFSVFFLLAMQWYACGTVWWVYFAFPWWLVKVSTLSYIYLPLGHSFLRRAYLSLLPFVKVAPSFFPLLICRSLNNMLCWIYALHSLKSVCCLFLFFFKWKLYFLEQL